MEFHPTSLEFSNLKYWLILTTSFQLTSLAYNSIHVGEYLKANIICAETGNDDIPGKSGVTNRPQFQRILSSHGTRGNKTMTLQLNSI